MIEGVDYSRTGHADWGQLAGALTAAGKRFAWRYAVDDKAPSGRGIAAAEYRALRAAGIDVGLYWEGSESWMLGGEAAGVAAARNAEANRAAAGMPEGMPIYFAHDIDPEPRHFGAIDACLRGAASVVGWDRVGVYGGWLLMNYLAGGGTVKWLCQTLAWEYGNGLHPAAGLYQYGFNKWYGGTNCDLVRATREHVGQASMFDGSVEPVPAVKPPRAPTIPWKATDVGVADWKGVKVHRFLGEVTARRNVPVYDHVGTGKQRIGLIEAGQKGVIRGAFRSGNSRYALIDLGPKGVGRASLSGFAEKWPLP